MGPCAERSLRVACSVSTTQCKAGVSSGGEGMETRAAAVDPVPGGRKRRRRARRLLGAALALAVVAAFLGVVPGFVLAYVFLHPLRQRVRRTPARYGLRFERVTLTSPDGTRL